MPENASQSNNFGAVLLLVVGAVAVIVGLVRPTSLVESLGSGPAIGAFLGGGIVAIVAGLWKLLGAKRAS